MGKLLDGKMVVGHALKNDFSALMFTPPRNMIRDTAHYRPYMRRKMNGTVRCVVLHVVIGDLWSRLTGV